MRVTRARARAGYSYFSGIQDGRHWERNLRVKYVVQSGPVKDLSFNLMQATHRVSGDHVAESNVHEVRFIVEYALNISL